MFGEDMFDEQVSKILGIVIGVTGDEQCHFGESINYYKNAVVAVRSGQSNNEIHRDGNPRAFWNWKELEWTKRFMMG